MKLLRKIGGGRTVASLLVLMSLFACKRYDKDISRIDSRLDQIENTQINTLNQQVASINKSIPQLQKTDEQLKGYIDDLQYTAIGLQKSINDIDSKIDKVRDELNKVVSVATSDILSQLESVRTELQGQLDRINTTIATLQEKDKELERKISDLKSYADDEIQKSKDWATATFSTLEQYNAVTSEIAVIKQSIESLNSSVESLEKKIKEDVSKEVAAAVAPIKDQILSEVVSDVTESCASAIASAKDEITNAYKSEIASSINALEASLKDWINNALTGYSTVSETEAKLAALKDDIESQLNSQKTYLEGLVSALGGVLTEKIENNSALLNELRTNLSSVQDDVAASAQQIADNADKISSNSRKINENTSSISDNSTAIGNLEQAMVVMKKELDTKISALESDLGRVDADVNSINEAIASMRKDYAERISDLQTILEGKVAENRELINANKAAISDNTKSIAANKAAIDALKVTSGGSADSFAAQILANAEKIAANAESISSNASLIAANTEAINRNSGAIADNTAKISELESQIGEYKSEITESYKAAIAEAINEAEGRLKGDVANEVAALNSRIDRELETVKAKMEDLEKRVETLEDDITSIKAKVLELGDAMDSIIGRISTVEQQTDAINASISKMQETDAELKKYIDNLQDIASELQESIAAGDAKINEVRNSLEQAIADMKASDVAIKEDLLASIEAAKSETLSQLSAMKTEMERKLSDVTETMDALKSKDTELENKIDELTAYVNGQIQSTKDWASATFATMEQYVSMSEEMAALRQMVDSQLESLSTMEEKLKGEWTEAIESAVGPVKDEIGRTADELTAAYTLAISTAKSEMESAYKAALASSVSSLESSLKDWVNSALTGYCTIAETDAKIAAQKRDVESQLAAQKTYLEELISSLEASTSEKIQANEELIKALRNELAAVHSSQKANADEIASLKSSLSSSKEDITQAYTEAISSAINSSEGKITEKINADIKEVNTRLDSEIAAVEEKIKSLDTRLEALENEIGDVKSTLKAMQDEIAALKDQITKIVNKVISISYVPTYEDGYEAVPYSVEGTTVVPGEFTLRFEVAPVSAAEDISKMWQSALAVKGVYTLKTRAAGDFINLSVKSTAAESGILHVTVKGNDIAGDFFNKSVGLNARLKISSGTCEVLSEYVPLFPERRIATPEYIDNNGVNRGTSIEIDGLYWAPVNVGASEQDIYGGLYSFEGAAKACPQGWRLPSKSELASLRKNCSASSEGVVFGFRFYGSTVADAAVDNVFLPAAGQYNTATSSVVEKGTSGYYWSSDEASNGSAYGMFFNNTGNCGSLVSNVSIRNSVRCVKDSKLGVSIPDAAFKAFLLKNFDGDKDGEISLQEAVSVKNLNISGLGISSLSGIEYFTNLEVLNCSSNAITNLDLKSNSKLKELNCSSNNLSELKLGSNSSLQKINASSNQLKVLETGGLPSLLTLDVSSNQISESDFSKNLNLVKLNMEGNKCGSIDVSSNTKLQELYVRNNASLKTVKLESRNLALQLVKLQFDYSKSELKFVDKSGAEIFYIPVSIDSNTWLRYNAGSSSSNRYGAKYTFVQSKTACPDGWRTPKTEELSALSKNYSEFVSFDGMKGRWMSGNSAYSENVPAIFMPAAGNASAYKDSKGYYWSSSTVVDPDWHFEHAFFLEFSDSSVASSWDASSSGTLTYSVRCIKK